MKKILIACFSLCLGFSAIGQRMNSELDIHSRTIDLNEKALAFGLTEAEFEAIKDQAYANPNFIPGTIYQDNKPVRTGVPMRYNAFADEIEIKQSPSATEIGALMKDPNVYVKSGTQFYVFVPFRGSNEKGGYFNVLHEGKRFSLYKKVTATFKEAQKAQSNYARDTPPSFPKTTTYYLVDNGTFLELPTGKSKIQNSFAGSKKDMNTFIKQNKLDLSNERDLIKAVAHYDQLHQQ
ncbi:MAG TPA: hypothetical protein VFF21_04740 [Flavobacteriaceae bacterium]|nr:hypothetical protein [Flavobacteriaceae bacterium]